MTDRTNTPAIARTSWINRRRATAWGIAKDCHDLMQKLKFGTRTMRWRTDEVDACIEDQMTAAEEASAHEQKT